MNESSTVSLKRHPCRLVIETGENEGLVFPLRETVVSIGRGPDNTIQIIDTRMSRNHSVLIQNEDAWIARDLGSKNGTQVNGETIQGDYCLSNGDRLQIGDTTFVYEEESARRAAGESTSGLRVMRDDRDVMPSHVMKLRDEPVEGNVGPGVFTLPPHDGQRLSALYQIAEMISTILDLDELLAKVLDLIQEFLTPDRAGILLYDEYYDVLVPKVNRRPENCQEDIIISSSIINKAVSEQVAVLVSDAPRDNRFQASDSIVMQRIQSAICAPFICKQEVLGVLYLDRRFPSRPYAENDLKMVCGIANQAALAIANSRLHHRLVEQHAREWELEIARSIQENLLPKNMPDLPGFQISGLSRPAHAVGGDYFDVISLPDGRLVIAIADVSGKGVPAAILIASVRSAVQLEVRSLKEESLVEVVDRLNQMVCRDTLGSMFVTMVLGLLDPAARTLTYCNAGHVHPLLRQPDGRIVPLDVGGCFLGIMPSLTYEQSEAALVPGSLLLLYSDGVTDIINERREMFGVQRLVDFLENSSQLTASEFCQRLEQAAQTFREGAEPFDDFTLLVLKSVEL